MGIHFPFKNLRAVPKILLISVENFSEKIIVPSFTETPEKAFKQISNLFRREVKNQ